EPPRRRPRLICDRIRLPSIRRRLLPPVGLVATRGLGGTSARATRRRSRSRHSSRLALWLRLESLVITSSPAAVTRRPARRTRRWSAPGSSGRSARATRSSTLVLTLLTFWPPGPDEREAVKCRILRETSTPGARRRRAD